MNQYTKVSTYLALLIVPIFLGFYHSYFKLLLNNEDIPKIIHIHVFSMLLWISLLIIQPILIKKRLVKAHKIIGRYSPFLVIFIVLVFSILLHHRFELAQQAHVDVIRNLVLRLAGSLSMVSFVLFYVLALKNKHNLSQHMRYMIATGLTVLPPSLGRIFYALSINPTIAEFSSLLIVILIVSYLIIKDKKQNKNYQAYKTVLLFHLGFISYYICAVLAIGFKLI